MRTILILSFILLLLSARSYSQQIETHHLKVVDTLTAAEKVNRHTVILQSELDSLVKAYNESKEQWQLPVQKPVSESKVSFENLLLTGVVSIIALLLLMAYWFYRYKQKVNLIMAQSGFKREEIKEAERSSKLKVAEQSLESKIINLNSELHILVKENEGLTNVIKEYNGIQHEYDSLKHGILKAYKVKNYPGYDKAKKEQEAIQVVLDTEANVANYAYEKFLKPILSITDKNKNSPVKISETEQQRILDLLVSLSLLYIEYLYLRVNELAIGGKMVQRIQGFSKGNNPDASLLKNLNTTSGNRALVMRIVLDKAGIHQLVYPVFDETNLNNP